MTAAIAAPLSAREFEILEAMAQGGSTKAIAQRFFISETTVRNHYGNINAKLGTNSKLGAVAVYYRMAVDTADFVVTLCEKYGVQLTDKHRTELARVFKDAKVYPHINRSNNKGWGRT